MPPLSCRSLGLVVLVATLLAGCARDVPPTSDAAEDQLFIAREAKLHPVFTKVADFNADGRVDGIDALVELHDQFGDTTKGAGTFTFELFGYKAGQPDPRGERLSDPWQVPVITEAEQRERWSRASRCYTFRLEAPQVSRAKSYVLALTYAPADGNPRSFDRIVLAGVENAPASPNNPSVDTSGGASAPGPQGTIDSLPPR